MQVEGRGGCVCVTPPACLLVLTTKINGRPEPESAWARWAPGDSVQVSGAFLSFPRPVLTEIHLPHACSCQESEPGRRRRQALVACIVDGAVVAAHEAEHTAGWVLGLALERALDIGAEPQVRTRDTYAQKRLSKAFVFGGAEFAWSYGRAGTAWRGME
eukprot:COSAG01_NODE_2061_length_8482_cov_6.301925_5_plen_159_part_00